jgi:type III secretion protein C
VKLSLRSGSRLVSVFTLLLLLLLSLSCWPGKSAHAAVPAEWKDTSFMINANGMTLRKVLDEFGMTYGIRLSMAIKGEVRLKGSIKADSGMEFLDRLGAQQGFLWFVYNDTLYIVPRNDTTSMRMEVGQDAVQDAKTAVIGLGLFDKRFGWGELPDDGVVIVSGPREYVELVRGVLLPEVRKAPSKGRQMMVFRLKYANANDRTITTRGQKEVIPGIKTILSGLFNGATSSAQSSASKLPDVSNERRSRSAGNRSSAAEDSAYAGLPLPGASLRGVAQYPNTDSGKVQRARDQSDSDDSSTRSKPVSDDHPRIDADPNLNAIIIYDNISKREMYKALIAELDIEPKQIEIEALIVDIDRSKMSELGVEWNITAGTTSTTVNGTGTDSLGTATPLSSSTLLINNPGKFYARLRAMESSGDARVLARPTVLTLDNMAAVLDLSQTAYVSLVGERVADLSNVTAGTSLRVVPRILSEGAETRVRLEVDIEDGSIKDPTLKQAVTRSTISTQAIVNMQQTLMIGGYHSESVSTSRQKVPGLGDIPLIGGLFRSNSESTNERERLFLITPRLSGGNNVSAQALSRANQLARNEALADSGATTPAAADAANAAGGSPRVDPFAGGSLRSPRRVSCVRPKNTLSQFP